MIRKSDKYLLLFILMIGFLSLKLNAQSLKPNAESLTANGHRSSVNDTLPISKPDTLPSGIIIIPPTQGQLYLVGNIFISGNKVTRSFIITRELPFKPGDSLTLQQLDLLFCQRRAST